MKRISMLLVIVLCAGSWASAQSVYERIMQKMQGVNSSDLVSYDYKIKLISTKSGKVTDSLIGRLYKDHSNYIDSNERNYSSVNNGYYVKLNYANKLVSVYNIKQLQKHLKMSMEAHKIMMPDSIIKKYASIKIDSSDKHYYKVEFIFRKQMYAKMSMQVARDNYLIHTMTFETPDMGDRDGRRTIFSLYNIHFNGSTTAFNKQNIYKVNGNTISLTTKYAGYKLKTLN